MGLFESATKLRIIPKTTKKKVRIFSLTFIVACICLEFCCVQDSKQNYRLISSMRSKYISRLLSGRSGLIPRNSRSCSSVLNR